MAGIRGTSDKKGSKRLRTLAGTRSAKRLKRGSKGVDRTSIVFKGAKEKLEKSLLSAFRQGASANRLGLMKEAYSDHLPVDANLDDIHCLSWNVLANIHLFNNYRNVSGLELVNAELGIRNVFKDRLHFFFPEFARFLLERTTIENQKLVIYRDITKDFVDSLLVDGKLKSPLERLGNARQVFSDFRKVVNLLLDQSHENHNEFLLSIQHALEITHAIDSGPLDWDYRFKLLKENKALAKNMAEKDFLCFQECTSPSDMLKYANSQRKDNSLEKIEYKVKEKTTDNCVILYDTNKYELLEELPFGLSRNSKPCLLGLFRDKNTGQDIIIGSIHHPGGRHNEIKEIIDKIQELRNSRDISFLVLGDYNHTKEFVERSITDKDGIYYTASKKGTMAGNDFGNVNKSIDGGLSSSPKTKVKLVDKLPLAPPSELPFREIEVQGRPDYAARGG